MKPLPHACRPPRSSTLLVLSLVLTIALMVTGCASNNPVPYAREYPEAPQRQSVLDIQVFRSARHIELTNTTARDFGPSTIWLNMHYSRPIDGLAVGETLRVPLSSFRNEFSEAFRGGGFFAPEQPERLVLAELEPVAGPGDDPERPVMHRLVVVGGGGVD